ncbi:MAG: hypothetical protein IBX61_04395 [Thermoleophilia bacterium]|nr:hypothetical protein [Thermoleophilia bacterium]
MGKLGKKFEDLMAASSFAEAGEPEAARELLKGSKKVLLVLTGEETDTKSLGHAINIAQRTGADLEVLTAGDVMTGEALKQCEEWARSQSVGFRAFRKKGCLRDATLSHTKNRRDLVCVVIESTHTLKKDCAPRGGNWLDGVWKHLGCPLTLVSEKSD